MNDNLTILSPIVIKLGSGVLAEPGGCAIDQTQIDRFALEIALLKKKGVEVILVTSAAIAAGLSLLNLTERPKKLPLKQACAAVGQPALMHAYQKAFATHDISVAQLLLTHHDIYDVTSRGHAQETLRHLLGIASVIPIINENDSVATEELGLGDNDRLSAEVASMMGASTLFLITHADGLKVKPSDATLPLTDWERIPVVEDLQEAFLHVAPEVGLHSTGGMRSKLEAVAIAAQAGIESFILHGHYPLQMSKALAGEDVGTRFLAS